LNLRQILEAVARREIDISEAEKLIKLTAIEEVENLAKMDVSRELRRGVPEVVLAQGKTCEQLAKIVLRSVTAHRKIIISRVGDDQEKAIRKAVPRGFRLIENELAKIVVVEPRDSRHERLEGTVGIMTAGTSDIPVAEEAKFIVEHMGCKTVCSYDVGVAGVHRLFSSVRTMTEAEIDVLIAVAGREGALPTVVAGLVDVPVIAVPTSIGYGFGGKGLAALQSMLQACSLGIAVVNIDSGLAAGMVAALIVRRLDSRKRRSAGPS